MKKTQDKLKEECAVFGVSLKSTDSADTVCNGLLSLQHRGQESAGIAVLDGMSIYCVKDTGLVTEIFYEKVLSKFPKSKLAVGHTRYSTTGASSPINASPFVTEYLTGRIAVSHNGNITNSVEIKQRLIKIGVEFEATSDSEVISKLVAYRIAKTKNVLKGIIEAANELEGAFSLIIITNKGQLIAVRDPNGYRPLCIGKNENGYAVASESCALDNCCFEFVRDVAPGEIIVIENAEIVHTENLLRECSKNGLCIFEYVYFARPDSIIDGQNVYTARYNMGAALAKEYPADADIVCGVPDSGLDAASGYSMVSGIPLVTGFVKNRYVGRSFICTTQAQRETAVRIKLNPLPASVKGKRVVLVDDSIVRGTTIKRIVDSLKNAGAKEVHLRISSPPFKNVCNFGTDIGDAQKLIANKLDIEGITKQIGADSLGYISLEGLKKSCSGCKLQFCTACF